MNLSTKEHNTLAIILAAGSGVRLQSDIPKQYLTVGGKGLIEYSIEVFEACELVSHIAVAVNPEHEVFYGYLRNKYPNISFYNGGETRQDSVLNGLSKFTGGNYDKVLVHDAARPIFSVDDVSGLVKRLQENDAVTLVAKYHESAQFHEYSKEISYLERDKIFSVKTPQAFDFELLKNLHEQYKNEIFTDDFSLFLLANKRGYRQYKLKLDTVFASKYNIKVTDNDDLQMIKSILESKNHENKPLYRIGQGFDVHAFCEHDNNKSLSEPSIRVCGVDVPHQQKLKGHSDADVGWHALVDAMLGAIAEGDIGEHFNDKDERWRGADSELFLKFAGERVAANGYKIANIDITLIGERPKFSAYKQQMQARTADILGLASAQVNIKATTTEKMGFLGRSEGLAAQATILLYR